MASQSYELSFGLSIVIIFCCIVFMILALNLLVSLLRFVIRSIWGCFKISDDKETIQKQSQEMHEHSVKQD